MVSAALSSPPFQAISPDSSLWLDRLEQQWAAGDAGRFDSSQRQMPIAQRRIASQTALRRQPDRAGRVGGCRPRAWAGPTSR
jgi:hypothetical protein